ncbi:ABC transporter permease [Verminephrobacter aporrectodeae subsp. tuberculatae]|uniref:ABC transporter permease n=1 Tax=Verminephrobacter aporrectodeae TaxID=1110389 RepID=UPI002243F178|nr:ABC transporter permease [Verminephrobacter aporrectodeae]MCW8163396.1 ABC transporter permease [Verminephrobacter aporrectodeae subsp. tuberculatae]MCW8167625.1 ABC transporter permease [Verminephrobacter aporrectodeae subsp. tuberculatae]
MHFDRLRPHLPWITLVLLTLAVGVIEPGFLAPTSLIGMVADISTLFVLALGITPVIYIGGIDLSAQSIANMTTVLFTLALPVLGVWSAPGVLLAGAALGFASGHATTRLKLPSFIATLALGGVAISVGQYASGQQAVYMDAKLRDATFGWVIGNTAGVPNEIFIAAALLLVLLFVERRTRLGRALKAIGAGEPAARTSGLRVDHYKTIVYALAGLISALAGLLFAVKLAGGAPNIAEGFLLPAIVAVLLGGTPLTGGVGGVLNTLIGALTVAVIRTAMVYLEVPATAQQIVFGSVLIVAIALTIDRTKLAVVK